MVIKTYILIDNPLVSIGFFIGVYIGVYIGLLLVSIGIYIGFYIGFFIGFYWWNRPSKLIINLRNNSPFLKVE